MYSILKLVIIMILCPCVGCELLVATVPCYSQPEQVHLSFGGSPDKMWVTWVTLDAISEDPTVEYGSGPGFMDTVSKGYTTRFWAGIRIIYIHRVMLSKLIPGRTYLYHVGSNDAWSPIFFFRALKAPQPGFRYAIFGDLGNWNAQSLSRLQQESQRGHFDMALHIGDFAYDLNTDLGKVGDQFFRQIEPIAAYVPYI